MKTFNLFSVLVLMLLFVSCNGEQKEASEKVVNQFYVALRSGDSLEIKKKYPNFDKLGGHLKSSKIEIKQTEAVENDCFEVTIQNSFTNIKNKTFSQEIKFICQENSKNKKQFIIKDSRGLNDFKETREYVFANQTGFIKNKEELTDQETAAKILKSQDLLELFFKEKIESLRKEVVIENWGWEYGYVKTYADGHGKVVNNSKDDFATLKFALTFVDDNGTVTQTDDGYLGYDKLEAGKSRDFTTLTSNIGNATKAYIQVQFDTYDLLESIYNNSYSGNEYKLIK